MEAPKTLAELPLFSSEFLLCGVGIEQVVLISVQHSLRMRSVWIFGYGSLIWRPGFEYETSMVGHVKGFQRVFYQGNDRHRGNPERWGRVATLMDCEESTVWGRAFLVNIDEGATDCPLAYLDNRESKQGGYATLTTTFYPRAGHLSPVEALVYVALPNNSLYLGPRGYTDMAREIIASQGECGSNVEYVLNIADFMREEVYGIDDEHLFMLEMHILSELQHWTEHTPSFRDKVVSERSSCAKLVHAANSACDDGRTSQGCAAGAQNKQLQGGQAANGDDFTSSLLARKLRCVDI
ncbi:glutathione-specific gamma-glutamylcyclotransferase 1 [Galendromus occidentalis]|uniref:glutathione-specific gamma-glutamylcyclotransferase n=1 Tax=Galendromus occidentalis TaxID=34638 RepID=A0AAJ6QMA5_9ACAR|nr:glutathione-specific gamma-glutamylcyclotransferase 1 [Galendromus occidentalis]